MLFGLILGLPAGWLIHYYAIERYALLYVACGVALYLFTAPWRTGKGSLANMGTMIVCWPFLILTLITGLDTWVNRKARELEESVKKPSQGLVDSIADELRKKAIDEIQKRNKGVN